MAVHVDIDFSKGINTVVEPHLVPEGFMFVADNVDLRHGSLRAYRFPAHFRSVTQTTTRIWSYRGTWYESALYRDYSAEFVGNQERIYFTELGPGHVAPRKIINNVQATLGTNVPKRPLTLTEGTSLTPGSVSTSFASGSGSLQAGSYTYRVAARMKDGSILPASNAVTGTVPASQSGSITITWSAVDGADKYIVFGRASGEERFLAEVASSVVSYVDTGSAGLGSTRASNFDPVDGYSYFYTFVRDVNGYQDESGPSPIAGPINTILSRVLSRDSANEGLFTATATMKNPSTSISSAATTATSRNIIGIQYYTAENKTAFITDVDHALVDDDYAWINFGDPSLDKTWQVKKDAALGSAGTITLTVATGGVIAQGTYNCTVYPVRCHYYGSDDKNLFLSGALASGTVSATQSTTISTSDKKITLNWSTVTNADAYLAVFTNTTTSVTHFRLVRGTEATYDNTVEGNTPSTAAINAGTSGTRVFTIYGVVFVYSGNTSPNISGNYDVLEKVSTTVTLGAVHGFTTGQKFTVSMSNFSGSGINGFLTATATSTTAFSVPVYTSVANNSTTIPYTVVIGSQDDTFYKFWRIYRTGDVTAWLRVAEVDVNTRTYTDRIGSERLGEPPDSFYVDNDKTVTFEPPPKNMHGIVDHYGMKFGIVGNAVRWTPISRPDAWPEVFTIPFAFPPLKLVSYASFLVVLCQDRPYIINGFEPTALTRSTALSNDGCVAPYSAQIVNNQLVYLASRGVVIFNGQESVCITDQKVIGQFFTAGSTITTDNPEFWWFPTEYTANYANSNPKWNKFGTSGNQAGSPAVINWGGPQMPGPNFGIRSFVYNGKYFLYWTDDKNTGIRRYKAHTTISIDFGVQGFPITTLGLKILDAHVDEFERPYVLLDDYATGGGGGGGA